MSAAEEGDAMRVAAEALVAAIKVEPISLADARRLVSVIRETQGWLASARKFLDPAQPKP